MQEIAKNLHDLMATHEDENGPVKGPIFIPNDKDLKMTVNEASKQEIKIICEII